jgi:glyoxylase-like metal-dependent hydrolase (beta-lactamase superfamily II)
LPPIARRGTAQRVDEPYDSLDELEPGIARVLARNPSAFTFTGTQTWFVATGQVAIIDPGPDSPEHVDALVAALGGRDLVAILCTHTHRDHSPAAAPLAKRTGAPIVGCAPLALETVGPRADAAFDWRLFARPGARKTETASMSTGGR